MSLKINHAQESITPLSGVLKVDASGALALPGGDASHRPSVSAAGYLRFDQADIVPEYFDGNNWQTITNKQYVDSKLNIANATIQNLALNDLTDVNVLNPVNDVNATIQNAYLDAKQNPPLVPDVAYDSVFCTSNRIADRTLYENVDNYCRIDSDKLTFKNINNSAVATANVDNNGTISSYNCW